MLNASDPLINDAVLICNVVFNHSLLEPNSILYVATYWTKDSESVSVNDTGVNLVMADSLLFINTLLNISNNAANNGEYVCLADIEIADDSLIQTTITASSSVNVPGRYIYFHTSMFFIYE